MALGKRPLEQASLETLRSSSYPAASNAHRGHLSPMEGSHRPEVGTAGQRSVQVTTKVALVSLNATAKATQAVAPAKEKPSAKEMPTPQEAPVDEGVVPNQDVGDEENAKIAKPTEADAAPAAPLADTTPPEAPVNEGEVPKQHVGDEENAKITKPTEADAAPAAPLVDTTLHEAPVNKVNDPKESVKDMDSDEIIKLVPELAAFHKSLAQIKDGGCAAVDGGNLMYGCGFATQGPNKTQVRESEPACGCSRMRFESCWQPDADSFLKSFNSGDIKTATEVAKAYLGGTCYTPAYVWVAICATLGLLAFFLVCVGGSSYDKENDPRLKGSALDPTSELS